MDKMVFKTQRIEDYPFMNEENLYIEEYGSYFHVSQLPSLLEKAGITGYSLEYQVTEKAGTFVHISEFNGDYLFSYRLYQIKPI